MKVLVQGKICNHQYCSDSSSCDHPRQSHALRYVMLYILVTIIALWSYLNIWKNSRESKGVVLTQLCRVLR